jgi:hypothetical protein
MNTNMAHRATKIAAAAAISLSLALGVAGTAFAGTSHAQPHQIRSLDHGVSGRHHHHGRWSVLKGTVTEFDATTNTITITGRHGVPVAYTTTPATTYRIGHTAGSTSDVMVGERVELSLSSSTPETVTSVAIELSHVEGTVSAISETTLSIRGRHGTTVSVTTSPSTTYKLSGAASTFSAIAVGSKVVAVGLSDSTPSTLAATAILINAPCAHVQGVVTAVNTTGNTITVERHHGVPVAYATTPTTTFFAGKTAVTSSAVVVGEHVSLTLTTTTPQTVTSILIHLDAVVGTVSTITGTVLTVTGRDGMTFTVNTSAATTYANGGTSSTFAAIAVGAKVAALGLPNTAPSTLDASAIYIFVGGFGHRHVGFGHHSRR